MKKAEPQTTADLTPDEREIVMQMRCPTCLLDDFQQMADLFVQITRADPGDNPPEITERHAMNWLANRMAERATWMSEAMGKEKAA
ncbi:hypothetical protein AA0242T_2418 [Acetobacter aceti NRIC 0242]|uniref:Uncharacterized protein n=1 Tax=Acetobacter aceti NBRC 14818 TaxID=887700 RepID=A0AB33IKY1_ACEAC|nr:hypothetical protein [Acetobacter aceti]TCS32058.1 hypothetical protein EDC15_11393 [Acetobacter aceti NBRC 14818]BCK77364.1 hypothetical protein EMQ_2970 [Acetobacter aceti NBRC 14818]GAN58765.1 hypothetical protein Abac_066_002 [Acetobacter aceti NBRC 14818]GBO81716.1 hypothetical protein AA0242T_2418 [Acetobacter aceti NRIC 0242]